MILLCDSLRKDRYTRSYKSLVRVVNKWLKPEIMQKQTKKSNPYKRAEYPGQKVQIDVKYVPTYCTCGGKKYYQYTALNECTRWTFRELYDEHSTYCSTDFIVKLIKIFPAPIREIKTDNGSEFTKTLTVKDPENHKTRFEKALEVLGIIYHRIRVATPQHNGKVERQHRCDELRFYKKMRMYNLNDGREKLRKDCLTL